MDKALGRRMAGARVMMGLTTEEMAALVERSVSAIRAYERGVNEPSGPVLAAWAEATGKSMKWLLTGEEEASDLRIDKSVNRHPGVERLATDRALRARHHITDGEIERARTLITPWPIPDENAAVEAIELLRRIQPD